MHALVPRLQLSDGAAVHELVIFQCCFSSSIACLGWICSIVYSWSILLRLVLLGANAKLRLVRVMYNWGPVGLRRAGCDNASYGTRQRKVILLGWLNAFVGDWDFDPWVSKRKAQINSLLWPCLFN